MNEAAWNMAESRLASLSYEMAGFLTAALKNDEIPKYHCETVAAMLARHKALVEQSTAACRPNPVEAA